MYHTQWGLPDSMYGLCWYHANYNGTKVVYGLGWGGQYVFVIPSLNAVAVVNENTADDTAIMQADNFFDKIFPLLFKQLQ